MVPAGYTLNPISGYYYYTDGSGPYTISPAGLVYQVGQGPQGPEGPPGDSLVASVNWGDILGVLSSQSDLNLALAAKSDSNHAHPTFTQSAPGFVPASGGGTTNFLRADGTFAVPPGGGGSAIALKEDNSNLTATLAALDFLSDDFALTQSPTDEINVALSAAVAKILAPVTISANTSLTKAAHGNRTLLVDTAGVVLTINNDATGGWTGDDTIDAQAIGSGTFTLVQGTATLTTDSGTSADSTTAISKRVQAGRTGTDAWRTLSPAIPSAAGNVVAYANVTPVTVPDDTNENTVFSGMALGALTAGTCLDIKYVISQDTAATTGGYSRLKINGTEVVSQSLPGGASQTGRVYYATVIVGATSGSNNLFGTWDLLADNTNATDPFSPNGSATVDVSSAATVSLTIQKDGTGRAVTFRGLNILVRKP